MSKKGKKQSPEVQKEQTAKPAGEEKAIRGASLDARRSCKFSKRKD